MPPLVAGIGVLPGYFGELVVIDGKIQPVKQPGIDTDVTYDRRLQVISALPNAVYINAVCCRFVKGYLIL